MPDKVIDIPDVGAIAFPDSMSDQEVNAAATRLYQQANPKKKQPPVTSWVDTASNIAGTALPTAAVAASLPPAATAALGFATSPTAPKTLGAAANAAVTLSALGHGAMHGNLSEVAAAPIAGWQAGKGGYFLGKRLQSIAGPVSTGLEAAAPVVNAAAGATGVTDLAQMAEPGRADIGTAGLGSSDSRAAQQAAVMGSQIKALVDQGKSRAEATRLVYNAWAKFLAEQRR